MHRQCERAVKSRLHWLRDVDFGEDASHIRIGKAPQTMAIFRNVAISLLGILGYDSQSRAASLRMHSADAVKLVIGRPRLSAWTKMK